MIKPSCILLLLCFTATVNAKSLTFSINSMNEITIPVPDKGDKSYSEVVDCGSVAQVDIFRRARLYLAQTALDNKTLVADKETGDLVSQGNITITIPRSEGASGGVHQLRYVLAIECANRKYRATITGELSGGKVFSSKSDKESESLNAALEAKLKSLLQELQASVKDYKPF